MSENNTYKLKVLYLNWHFLVFPTNIYMDVFKPQQQ